MNGENSQNRTNPFDHIYKICNSGNSQSKLLNLPEFPNIIDIELTNICNFNCLMCPTGTKSIKRKQGFMHRDIFFKLLNEIEKYKTPIRFIRWGEPLLHSNLIEFIKETKNRRLMCHLNTNGSYINDEYINAFIDIPLDSIKFSFQGIDRKSYNEMRNTDFYEDLLIIIEKLYKKRNSGQFPFIHVATTITYEDSNQVQVFKSRLKPISDYISVGRTCLEHIDVHKVKLGADEKERLKWLKNQETVIKKHPECPEVFDKLSINWDGTVSACCGDYDNKMIVGDMKVNSLKKIWHSKKLNYYRKILAKMDHDKLPLCKTCYDYNSLGTPSLQRTD